VLDFKLTINTTLGFISLHGKGGKERIGDGGQGAPGSPAPSMASPWPEPGTSDRSIAPAEPMKALV